MSAFITLFGTGVGRDFAELLQGGFKVFDPSTAVHGLAIALARGCPERSESRDDDFPDKHVEGGIVRLFEALVSEPKDVEAGFIPGDDFLPVHWRLRSPTCVNARFGPGDNHRPSIVSPPPGRYLNVGTEGGLCSCFCSTRLGSCSCGGSRCALQPLSNVRTTNQIDGLNRTILPFLFTD
jgi:hypothetical protein